MSSGRTSVRPGRNSNMEPMIYGEYIPSRSELSVSASGSTRGRITRDSPKFKELVENQNVDILFKDEERTGADRVMTQVGHVTSSLYTTADNIFICLLASTTNSMSTYYNIVCDFT